MVLLTALPGCNSKKEAPPQVPAKKGSQGQISSAHGQAQPVVAPPQDVADASALKARVLSQLKNKEFAAIYKEASDGFRQVGPEEQFVAQWNKQLQETGAFKEAKETGQSLRPEDRFLLVTYRVKYEKRDKELRLTFGRAKTGKMELTGINQREIK